MKVFLDYDPYEESSWASSDSSTSGWASEVGSTSRPLAFELLIACEHLTSDGLLAYELPASGPLATDMSLDTLIS